MRVLAATTLLLATGAAAVAAPAAPAATRLGPADIQKGFFAGQPFTAATPSGVAFKMTFTADGKMSREPVGRAGVKDSGTWKLDKTGFCTTWKGGKPNCFTLVTAGDNKWSVMKGMNLVATWSK